MTTRKLVHAATLDRFRDVVENVEGVDLRDLQPCTALLVQTRHSLYRIVIIQGAEVRLQGGAFFPDPTPVYVEGATIGRNCVRVGWIGVGLSVEIRSEGRRIITSPVRAITAEKVPDRVVESQRSDSTSSTR